MSDTETPRRRGRPATGKALTSAERMRRVRDKARLAFESDFKPDLSPLPDSALLDFLRQSYQSRLTYNMADAVRELFARANARGARYPLRPSFEQIEPEADIPATVTNNQPEAEIPATVADIPAEDSTAIPATVTNSQSKESPAIYVTVAVKKGKAKSFPTEVKATAVALADAGKTTPEIRAAILEACGRAPDITNLARLVRQ